MSGRDGYRSMWESMYSQCDAIVFVVDSADQMRFAVVVDELQMMLRHRDVADRPDVPILFVANKIASADACSPSAMAGALRLHERVGRDRPWRLASTDANTGRLDNDGLREAMEWLVELMKTDRRWDRATRTSLTDHETRNTQCAPTRFKAAANFRIFWLFFFVLFFIFFYQSVCSDPPNSWREQWHFVSRRSMYASSWPGPDLGINKISSCLGPANLKGPAGSLGVGNVKILELNEKLPNWVRTH